MAQPIWKQTGPTWVLVYNPGNLPHQNRAELQSTAKAGRHRLTINDPNSELSGLSREHLVQEQNIA